MPDHYIPLKLKIYAIIFSIALLLFIIELIRKNRLKEGYSILWFFLGISFLVISIWSDLLLKISDLIGIEYMPAMLLTVLVMGLLILMIYITVIISSFDRKHKITAQELGFLAYELKKIRELMEIQKRQQQGS